MTTIAWDGKTLAADTLITCDGEREGYGPKIWRFGPLLIAGDGSRALCLAFRSWVVGGLKGACPIGGPEREANGLVVMPNGRVVCWGYNGPWDVRLPTYALGSGGRIAQAALHLGKTAEEAVRFAIEHDTGSGGEVTVLSLRPRARWYQRLDTLRDELTGQVLTFKSKHAADAFLRGETVWGERR